MKRIRILASALVISLLAGCDLSTQQAAVRNIDILKNDPRPSYQNDPNRIYGMCYGGYEIKFLVENSVLTVKNVANITKPL